MTTASIQPLNIKACDTLSSIHAACFPRGWTESEFRDLFDHSHVIAYGCFNHSQMIGFIFGWIAGGDFELLTVAILPAYRKQGLARQLLEEASHHARKLGSHRIFLEVSVDNPAAHALYYGFGFETIGRRKGYYRHTDGTLEDALTMHCDI